MKTKAWQALRAAVNRTILFLAARLDRQARERVKCAGGEGAKTPR